MGFNLDDYEQTVDHLCTLIAFMADALLESKELTDEQTIALLPTAYALYMERDSHGF